MGEGRAQLSALHASSLLVPLETLATVEETVVRDKVCPRADPVLRLAARQWFFAPRPQAVEAQRRQS